MSISKNKIVVNADDFGFNSDTNKAILKSFGLGWISTTTIMPTMEGFEEACQLAHENRLLDRIGIHFNLTEGKPLSDELKKCKSFVGENGLMFREPKSFLLNSEEKAAVYKEFETQYKKCIKNGIVPTHADSHHHSHHYWDTGKILARFAKDNKIPAVRLFFNYGDDIRWRRRIYSNLFNLRLKKLGLAKTDFFCELRKVDKHLIESGKPAEIMSHPRLNKNGVITNYDDGDEMEKVMRTFLPGISFITYKELSD
jgi:hypothetical protein